MEGTVTGQRLIEKGIEEGIEEGIERARREAVLRVLAARFGPVPEDLAGHVAALHDPAALDELLTGAARADSLAAFRAAIVGGSA